MRVPRTIVSLIGVALTALGAAAQNNANTGLECWGLATGDAVASSSWPAEATKVDCSATDTLGVANKTAANTTSYQETSAGFAVKTASTAASDSKFCVQVRISDQPANNSQLFRQRRSLVLLVSGSG